jgi:hypothetical protein
LKIPVYLSPLSDFTQSADKDCTRKGIAGLTFIQPCLYASTQGRLPEPVMAVKRLCNALFGRTGSQWLIVEVFGEKGRQHRSTDSNPEAVEKMVRHVINPVTPDNLEDTG